MSNRTNSDLENDVAALEAQVEFTTKELEAKRAKLAAMRAAAAAKAAEVQKQIEAELIEKKIGEFVAAAAALDHGMTPEALGSFKRLAGELSMAGRLKQAHHARASLIERMLGRTVYRPPYPTWSTLAQAWLIPTQKAA
jgi:hypothetical protein